ncbi:MAG: MraY family glycosyltransferase [Pseudomonadota bacterium]|nr:MraY family glycosyltransferase [Pseudomonadota bacterium]
MPLLTSEALLAQLPLALFATVVFLALIGPLAALTRRVGWVDRPSERKSHIGEIPIAGGLGVLLTLLVTCLWIRVAPGNLLPAPGSIGAYSEPWAIGLAGGMLLIFVVAFIDDRAPIRARWRFIAQAAAVLAMVIGGTIIGNLGELLWAKKLLLPVWFAIPFTIFGVCGVVNALNMSDGIDGLGGGLALVATGWFALVISLIAASRPEAATLLPLTATLAGALTGFLVLNLRTPWRSKAAIFMGDSGSMMIGFMLGWLAVRTSNNFGDAGLPPVVALYILAVPLVDTISCILRRIASGVTPMTPDQRHLHHLLLATGLSVGRSVAVILGISVLLGGFGILGWRLGVPDWAMFWSAIALFFAYHLSALRFWANQTPASLASAPGSGPRSLRDWRGRLGGAAKEHAPVPNEPEESGGLGLDIDPRSLDLDRADGSSG